MTSLTGYLIATYHELVEVLGEPTYMEWSGDHKVSTEWDLRIDDVVVTIYDWKEESENVCRSGQPYRWHIGGNSRQALAVLEDHIGIEGQMAY